MQVQWKPNNSNLEGFGVKDSWDKSAKKYLKGIENHDFEPSNGQKNSTESKKLRYLPIRQIFEDYKDIQLKKGYDDSDYFYVIPCKLTVHSNESFVTRKYEGALEVTLAKTDARPVRVFFNQLAKESYAERAYGKAGTEVWDMLEEIKSGDKETDKVLERFKHNGRDNTYTFEYLKA